MTSPSPEEARAALESVVGEVLREHWMTWDGGFIGWHCGCGHKYATMVAAPLHQAIAVLDAALAERTEVECETCGGYGGVGHTAEGEPNPTPCPTCHGSGSRSLYLLDVIRKADGRDTQ